MSDSNQMVQALAEFWLVCKPEDADSFDLDMVTKYSEWGQDDKDALNPATQAVVSPNNTIDGPTIIRTVIAVERAVAADPACDLVAILATEPRFNTFFERHAVAYAKKVCGWTGQISNNPPPDLVITSIAPNTGVETGGIVVTIVGENFVDGAKVTFGGVEGTDITFVPDTELKVKVPAHAEGTVDIVVTNLDGRTVTKTGGFTYTKAPARSGGRGGGSGSGRTTSSRPRRDRPLADPPAGDSDDDYEDEPVASGVSVAELSGLVSTVTYGNIQSFKAGAAAVGRAIDRLSPHMAKPAAPEAVVAAAAGAVREASRPKRTWVLPVVLGLGFAGLIVAVLLAGLLLLGGGIWAANVVEGPTPSDPTAGTAAAPVDLGDGIVYEGEIPLVLRIHAAQPAAAAPVP